MNRPFSAIAGAPELHRGVLVLAAGALAACWIFFGWASGRGFTLGDEANYLIEASQAAVNRVSLSQYASVWNPMYLLVGGNVAAYRFAGFVVLQLLAAFFGYSLSRFSLMGYRDTVATVLASAVGACCFYGMWLPTPNYNLLNLCGLLLFMTGLLLASSHTLHSKDGQKSISNLVLTAAVAGIGLGLTFLSKPPSFVLAAAAGIVWVWGMGVSHPLARIAVATLAACTTFLLAALLIDGSIVAFVSRIEEGFHFLNVRASQGQGYGIVNSVVGPLMPERLWKVPPVAGLSLVIFVIFASLFFMLARSRISQRRFGALLAGACAVAGCSMLVSRALDADPYRHFPLNHLWYLIPMLAFFAALFGTWRFNDRRGVLAMVVILFGIVIFGFGTNSTLIRQMAGASIFWFSGLLMLLNWVPQHERARYKCAVVALTCTTTLALLAGMSLTPLGANASLWEQTVPVVIGRDGSKLKLDRDSATYITSFQQAAVRNRFEPGTPILDFGAQGPGMSFAVGGTAPGQAWLTFGRSNDTVFASHVLSMLPSADLATAWIFTGQEETQKVAQDALGARGLNFPGSYELVLVMKSAARGWEHRLWKPAASRQ